MITKEAVRAIVAHDPTTPGLPNWTLQDVDVSSPRANEVLVEMVATGICHTDLVLSSIPRGMLGIQYPKVVGHEGAGYVRAVGKEVRSVEIGDPVLLSFDSCTSCDNCKDDHPSYCDSFATKNYSGEEGPFLSKEGKIWGRFFGQSSFGSYSIVSEASVVNAKDLVHSKDELKLFAPLGCGFQTGAGAINNIGNARATDVVLVLGLGAVGMAAIMAAKIRGCEVIIGLDRYDDRLEIAKELGATHILNTAVAGFDLHEEVQKISKKGSSITLDTTGVPQLIEQGLAATGRRGKLILIGVPPLSYNLGVPVGEHMNTGKSVIGCIEGDSIPAQSIRQFVQWYREGRFPIDKLIKFLPAEEFPKALHELKEGLVIKPVLVWS